MCVYAGARPNANCVEGACSVKQRPRREGETARGMYVHPGPCTWAAASRQGMPESAGEFLPCAPAGSKVYHTFYGTHNERWGYRPRQTALKNPFRLLKIGTRRGRPSFASSASSSTGTVSDAQFFPHLGSPGQIQGLQDSGLAAAAPKAPWLPLLSTHTLKIEREQTCCAVAARTVFIVVVLSGKDKRGRPPR
ncbi:hypothetical protein MYCTH_2113341 [Thermothelomyces thermophilus ATCC 42464]|uniref:Uncharacterized protein n=1 Tax=Thermothelomyces thermophilus (strain ATCC 42464 / BCRC 31852 / DSM 1799) TaxID=573729 RepID=G2QPB1_THET4|nr:uncharacterized protein MYCTH_2113341 [Thermothelomyces thermophilus ATCC 42464]AEO61424.1 hypothetical protein MYCTH_2113341 [Thermothelomyces thermophilus ATCC 42464]